MPTRTGARIAHGLVVAVLVTLSLAVPTVLAANRSIAIRDFAFAPKTLEVRVGDVVTWTNRDSVAHSATARGGTFDTGLTQPGQSGSVRFTIGGVYRYVCTPHPNMTGTVVVRAASGGAQPPNGPDRHARRYDRRRGFRLMGDAIGLAALGVVMLVGTFVADRRFRRPP